MKQSPLRIGLIGLGNISDVHISAYAADPSVKITALCDIRKDVLGKRAARFHIPNVYTDFRKMLRDPSVDAVDVMLPHALHAPTVLGALAAGKHVICEKPLSLRQKDVTDIERMSRRTGRHAHVKHYFRYVRAHVRLKELIDSGRLPKPYLVQALYTTSALAQFNDRSSWKGSLAEAGGGVFMDNGFHMTDLLVYLFGKPLSVYAAMDKRHSPLKEKGEDVSVTVFSYPDMTAGITCTSCDTSMGNRWDKRFFFPDRSIHLTDHGKHDMIFTQWMDDEQEHMWTDTDWWTGANISALADAVSRIRDGRPPAVSYEESRTAIQCMDAAYRSAKTGKRINISR